MSDSNNTNSSVGSLSSSSSGSSSTGSLGSTLLSGQRPPYPVFPTTTYPFGLEG
jgi:hypothetical protein